ncbi:MAG: heat shock protein HspQ [Gammaproteobacteria bacterium]|nr:heat shock protein HspQ [Gammaproteobacteria bacterium]
MTSDPRFYPGQIVEHLRFAYRGVIYLCDNEFGLTDDWYRQMAISRPPKNKPWYGVLVDQSHSTTYVAERNLMLSGDKSQIEHPDIGYYFETFDGREYAVRVLN